MERKRGNRKPTWIEVSPGVTLSYCNGAWCLSKGQVLQTPDDKIILFQDKNGIHEIAYSDDREIIISGHTIPLKKFKSKLKWTPGYEIPKSRIKVFLERLKWFFNFIV